MPNIFVDVRQDLVYAYGWPSRFVRPIWRVKRALKQAYASFRRFSCAIAHHFLGDPDSDVKNTKKILWTSVKTMHTVGHNGLSGPFGGSNETRSEHTPHFDDFRVLEHSTFWVIRIPTSKMPNLFADVRQDLVYAYGWPSRLVRPIWRVKRAPKRAYASFRRFSCAIAHHFLGDPDSNVKNAKFFRGRPSRPFLCIRMAMQTVAQPSAQVVGNTFVEQYYQIQHHSPESVYRFYQDSSVLSRPDANGVMTSVTTMKVPPSILVHPKVVRVEGKQYQNNHKHYKAARHEK
uniref:NTF2 domain-containing protein n=1 Tax=Solanum lycopersicum TaxID=4081 RepID=A0A3Q7ILC8_SOLLC